MLAKENEYSVVINNLKKYSVYERALTKDWIEKNITNNEQKGDKHYLFWELLIPNNCKKLSKALELLENSTYFDSLITKLKRYNDKDNFQALLTEILVLYYYKKRENDVLKVKGYEPAVPGINNKKNDVLLGIGGEDCYVEILTLMDDKIMRRNTNLEKQINNGLNSISDHHFVITYHYTEVFSEKDIGDFVKYVDKKIKDSKGGKLEYFEYEFNKNDTLKAVLGLYPSKSGKGYVGVMRDYVRKIENDRRLKSKILDKIDEQLSNKTTNILVINLLNSMAHLHDFFNAILGQEAGRINLENETVEAVRQPNGVIHDPNNRAKKVSVFIGFERGNYENRKKIRITNANNIIEKKYFELL